MATDKGFFNYWVEANSGKGFITHTDSRKFEIHGYPGNVWVCDDIPESRDWGARNSAATKTKSQAQTIVTGVVDDAKDAWDDNNVDGESSAEKITRLGNKPTDITLPKKNLWQIIKKYTEFKFSTETRMLQKLKAMFGITLLQVNLKCMPH